MKAIFDGRSVTDHSKTILNQMVISSFKYSDPSDFEASIIKHLECQLKFATRCVADNRCCPFYISDATTKSLHEHAELAHDRASLNEFEESFANIWSLCVALWGDQEYLEGVSDNEHISVILRRELLSQWLDTQIEKTLSTHDVSSDYLKDLLTLITSHKINEACDLAYNNGDINLSLLLSQSEGNKITRMLIKMQMDSWKNSEADRFIATNRLKAMMLVGGIESFESTLGTVDIYETMDWLRSLAV